MTTTSWAHGVSGDFDTPTTNWTNNVPMAGDTALIEAHGTYTVTSSQLNTLADLEMAKTATLDIADHHMVIASGTGSGALAGTIDIENETALVIGADGASTTFDNTGTINLKSATGSAADNAKLQIGGTVALTGNGKIVMSGNEAEISASSTNTATAELTSSNTISGDGVIGDVTDSLLGFTNAAKGIIDGNTLGGLLVDTDGNAVSNSGLMEATGASGYLILAGEFFQSATGQVKAATSGATVLLENADISGGSFTIVKGATLLAGAATGLSIIGPGKTVKNAGTIEANFGDLVIGGSVSGAGTLVASANNSLQVDDKVSGGKAEIQDAGEIIFYGQSSAAVTFASGSTGTLDLQIGSKFTGTVAGMSGNPGAAIDLENLSSADAITVNLNAHTHVLSVTDTATHVTDTIKIVGTGTFVAKPALDGTVLITDPPPGAANTPSANTQLLVQSMASLGASSAVAPPGTSTVADHHRSSDFLAAPHRG